MNTTRRTVICLRCPRGCEMTVSMDGEKPVAFEGNSCKLGVAYATEEVTDPRRVLPTTVRVRGGVRPLVPVWTPEPVPKGLLRDLARETRRITVEAPVTVGDVVLRDWHGLGIDLVASGEVAPATGHAGLDDGSRDHESQPACGSVIR